MTYALTVGGYRDIMRSEREIFKLILAVAEKDERIRAVILNGSRANSKIERDRYQDYDIVFFVKDLESFGEDLHWIDVFGERIIMQMPNTMQIDDEPQIQNDDGITYLMLFSDTNRIDLNLIKVENRDEYRDSLTEILLDKDRQNPVGAEPSDKDYWVKRPTQKQFLDCCNEFWWVSTYVVKGLRRNEIIYAKDMLDNPVRKMFMRMLGWYIGVNTDFSVNIGQSNKYMKNYVDAGLWNKIIMTYSDANEQNIRRSLREMINIFHEKGMLVATRLGFKYNREESYKVRKYLLKMGLSRE